MKIDRKITTGMKTKMNALTRPRRGMIVLTAATVGLALSAAAPAFPQGVVTETHDEHGMSHFFIGQTVPVAGGGDKNAAVLTIEGGQGAVVAPAAPSAPRSASVFGSAFFGQDRDEAAYYRERI